MIPSDAETVQAHGAPTPPTSLTVLMFASFVALTTSWTGVAGTIWFAIRSDQSGIIAALISGSSMGFGTGALIGSLVSHWGFADGTIHPLLRVVIPMVGAAVGLAVFGVFTAGVVRLLVLPA